MEDEITFENESDAPTKTIKDILKEEGRTQTWLRSKLEDFGIKRDKAQMSQYCTGKYRPKDEYILMSIAQIIGRDFEEINNCF